MARWQRAKGKLQLLVSEALGTLFQLHSLTSHRSIVTNTMHVCVAKIYVLRSSVMVANCHGAQG